MTDAAPQAVSLHVESFEPEQLDPSSRESSPLVIVHGLFGSSANWRSISKTLARTHRVYAVDCRNHGRSPWASTHTYEDLAADLASVIQKLTPSSAIVIGHSMGGKAAMQLALSQPARVKKLVVVDIAPVRYQPTHQGIIEALQSVDLQGLKSRKDADKALSVDIPEAEVRQFLLQSLIRDGEQYRWRINLETLRQSLPGLSDFPSHQSPHYFPDPTLFIHGETSEYVKPEEHKSAIQTLFPKNKINRVENAGHWLHAENPTAFLSVLQPFLT